MKEFAGKSAKSKKVREAMKNCQSKEKRLGER